MEKKIIEMAGKLAECQAMCNYCFDACLHEEDVNMMAKCIKLDRECAEICGVTLSFITSNSNFAKDILSLCATVCEKCAQECGKHHNDHCKACAAVCKECAEACRKFS